MARVDDLYEDATLIGSGPVPLDAPTVRDLIEVYRAARVVAELGHRLGGCGDEEAWANAALATALRSECLT